MTSLIMLGGVGYFTSQILKSSTGGLSDYLFFGLFTAIFVLIAVGWIPYDWLLRRSTWYALTDRRAI